MLDLLTLIEHSVSPVVVGMLELIGIFIIALGSSQALYLFFKGGFRFDNAHVKRTLGESLALSLEFKLGAEIIKTVIIRDLNELIILALVVAIRVILSFVIHWEVKQIEEKEAN